jgi:hypothetical protein
VERCGARASGETHNSFLGAMNISNADVWGGKGNLSGQVKRLIFGCELRHPIETAIATNARQLPPTIIPGGRSNPCALIGAYALSSS